ncbi:MAG TPA: hypothetical protein VGH88_07045 [Streptosporangiaceae bacterium]|jgi:hypothetical protein
MRLPQGTGRIRAEDLAGAPAQVLRAAFTQVGRLVMAADELRGRIREDRARGAAPPPGETGTHSRRGGPEVTAASAEPDAGALPAPDPDAAALPVPDYDQLSLPSLRARLRYLDAGQLRILLEYERSHARRTDILMMFERRAAKLAGQ